MAWKTWIPAYAGMTKGVEHEESADFEIGSKHAGLDIQEFAGIVDFYYAIAVPVDGPAGLVGERLVALCPLAIQIEKHLDAFSWPYGDVKAKVSPQGAGPAVALDPQVKVGQIGDIHPALRAGIRGHLGR
jgi:hypothetical protein